VIVTIDQKDSLTINGLKVDVVPAWEWLDAPL
jgi:hypothetical protein